MPEAPLVRPCRPGDLAALEEQLPTGPNRYHEARHRRQTAGTSTYLIACVDAAPLGSGEVLWPGPKEPEVRARFPGCPEINGLSVARRSQGIGTALIREAERLAAERGHHRIGLGVGDDNPRAAALYLRLGYAETGCHYLDRYGSVDTRGVRHEVADACRFLVKAL
jgi:GNAT superfamily N-acetyltransferase